MRSDELKPKMFDEMAIRVRAAGDDCGGVLERLRARRVGEADPLVIALLNAIDGLRELHGQVQWLARREWGNLRVERPCVGRRGVDDASPPP